jgi:fructose-1,6-bisphosphatase/inositol monophosphatase family enzyme
VLAGAAFYPAIDESLVAAPGAGCWWNGARCAVSAIDRLEQATVLTTDERFTSRLKYLGGWRRLARLSAVARTWGDCYGYLLVATGRAEAMVDPVMSPWDAAALQPIITEAGGCFTDWDGNETAFAGSVIATNRALCSEVQRVLSQD